MSGLKHINNMRKIMFSSLKMVGILLCLLLFIYQLCVVAVHYLDGNIFQSSKTQAYTGKWVMPVVTICPDPAIMDKDINMEEIR